MPARVGERLSVPVIDGAMMPAVVRRLDEAGVEIAEIALHLPSLDDVFRALTTTDEQRGAGMTREPRPSPSARPWPGAAS